MDKIICIGKNYLEHAKELGDAIPENPVIFLKPPSVLRTATNNTELILSIPPKSGALHYEAELVLRLSSGGYQLDLKKAEEAIEAVTIGLDMTLRDLQVQQKKQGHPWTTSKVFPDCAVVGPWLKISKFPHYLEEKFLFSVNGEIKQQGYGREMRLSPAQCISYASQFFPLVEGDLIFTGTPAGVGPILPGQRGELQYGPLRYSVLWALVHE